MVLLTISSQFSSVDKVPSRYLRGHGFDLIFFVPRSQHSIEYFIFHILLFMGVTNQTSAVKGIYDKTFCILICNCNVFWFAGKILK